jgi:hypothetical protein
MYIAGLASTHTHLELLVPLESVESLPYASAKEKYIASLYSAMGVYAKCNRSHVRM